MDILDHVLVYAQLLAVPDSKSPALCNMPSIHRSKYSRIFNLFFSTTSEKCIKIEALTPNLISHSAIRSGETGTNRMARGHLTADFTGLVRNYGPVLLAFGACILLNAVWLYFRAKVFLRRSQSTTPFVPILQRRHVEATTNRRS